MNSQELANLAGQVAPDFRTAPLYLALASEGVPGEFLPGDPCIGYHGPRLDLTLAPWLGARWRGRGPAIVIDDVLLRRDAESYVSPDEHELADTLFNQRLIAALLHESAHALERDFDTSMPAETDESLERIKVAAWCKAPQRMFPVPWYGHDARFIRTYLHLIHRAERTAAIHISLSLAFGWHFYETSSPWAYQVVLGDEPNRLAHLSFAELRETTPPQAFSQLWQRDVRKWFMQQHKPSAALTQLTRAYLRIFEMEQVL